MGTTPPPARLAELVGSLSVATDHAAGLPPETALRTSLVAVRLGRAVGLRGAALADVYYVGLLRFLGCSAWSHEMARRFAAGDDLRLLRELTRADASRPREVFAAALRGVAPDASLGQRVAAFARFATSPGAATELGTSHCELAVALGARLGMSEGVRAGLGAIYERWDGGGVPAKRRGEAIDLAARVVHVAWRLAAHLALGGPDEAFDAIARRAGHELDPTLVARATAARSELLPDLDGDVWTAFLAAEPAPARVVDAAGVRDVATAFGHFSDVKSPWTIGHSLAVAELAERAAERAELPDDARATLAIAARLHDLGRVAVRNGLWDKPGALTPRERAEVEQHAAEGERILARTALFEGVAHLAASAHERLDGRGYPHSAIAPALGKAARILAAADVAVALSEARPHRAALAREARVRLLGELAAEGRLCPAAVDAVLGALGLARGRREVVPGALTAREAEVIRHLVRGLSNKEIASALGVSAATVKRHLENAYEKLGHRTRAALSVWAVENGLGPAPDR